MRVGKIRKIKSKIKAQKRKAEERHTTTTTTKKNYLTWPKISILCSVDCHDAFLLKMGRVSESDGFEWDGLGD